MRVLLVVHQFFPHFTAGTEVLTWGVARELRSRGHTVRIVTGHPGRDELRESERWVRDEFDGFEVDRFHHAYVPMRGQRSMIEVGSDNVLAAHHFAGILAAFRPDRVHYFHLNRLGTGLILAAEAAGVRQSFTPTDFWTICTTAQLRLPDGQLCHGPSLHAGNCIKHFAQNPARAAGVRLVARALPTAWADALAPLARTQAAARLPFAAEVRALGERLPKTVSRLNRLQCILAPNAFMRAKLLEYGVRPERVVESAFGVDLPTIAPTREGRRPTDGPLRVGFIGTLGPHKGAHVLLSAFALLPRGACSLRIHGNPADFPDYVQELSALAAGLEDIVFAGTFPNHAIFDVMADLDVLVVPSLWYENTPLVVYSAQAAGTIVVASDHPGIAAVVRHEVDGLLFPSGDSAALAQQLRRLAADRELLARLAANVRPPRSTSDYVDDLLRFWVAL